MRVYQNAYALAMEVFNISKIFPPDERFSLPSQIRRSSRSVAANLAEGYRKRQYPNMFVSTSWLTQTRKLPRPASGWISLVIVGICQGRITSD